MNNKEVYINGQLIDLDEANNPIELVYSINDLAELKDRQAYSTNTFKAPLTRNNLAICGYPTDVNIILETPYRKGAGKVVQNGIEVLTNGVALILRASDSIEIQVLSGIIGFFDTLADKKISDLDLSDLDHLWTRQVIAASQTNTDGYIYPVIQYGGLRTDARESDARLMRPAIFRKTIIERIISEAGYTASGVYQTYDKYLRAVVPFAIDGFKYGKSYSDELAGYKVSARSTVQQDINRFVLEQDIVLQDDASTDKFNQWNGNVFTAARTMRVTASFKYSIDQIDIFFGGSTPETYMRIQYNNGSGWITAAQNVTITTFDEGDVQSFLDQSISAQIDLVQGGQIRISDLQQPATKRMASRVYAGAELIVTPLLDEVSYGTGVQMSATLPDVSQKDFFKDFLQNFGLIVIPDNYNKSLRLINMEEVYANKPNAIDITDKIIPNTDDVSFSIGSYGINNQAKYKLDEAVPEGTGDGVLVLDNLTAKENVVLFTSIFAASISTYFAGIETTEIKKIEDITKSRNFTVKTAPRILLNRTINSSQFRFFDGLGTSYSDTISVPLFDGLSYQTLIEENYPEILRMLFRPYLVSKRLMLKETDIASIDWTVPVYDRRTAAYYYRNEIKYIQGDQSTISLILMP